MLYSISSTLKLSLTGARVFRDMKIFACCLRAVRVLKRSRVSSALSFAIVLHAIIKSFSLYPRKVLRVSRSSIVSGVKDRVSSRDCQLTFERLILFCETKRNKTRRDIKIKQRNNVDMFCKKLKIIFTRILE